MNPPVSAVVEGIVDEAVVKRLLAEKGIPPGETYGKQGKDYIRKKVNAYNSAAHHAPWIVLVDLDEDAQCAPPLRASWLPKPAPFMCFRIAVREVEAWLLADRARIAAFLHGAVSAGPRSPEELPDPKETVVNLARRSRLRAIREDMVPDARSGRIVGPAYASRMIEYAERVWRPQVAADGAPSLRRAVACIERLVETARRLYRGPHG